jgi:hypothetical protein
MKLEAIVDPFSDLSSKSPDKQDKIEVQKDGLVELAFSKYKQVIAPSSLVWDSVVKQFRIHELKPLAPGQLNMLLQKMINYRLRDFRTDLFPGRFFTYMIKKTYMNGNYKISIDTGDTSIRNLGTGLTSSPAAMMHLTINGNVGGEFAAGSSDIKYHVKGDVGMFGANPKFCDFVIEGDVKSGAICSDNSRFDIRGDFEGYARASCNNCTFVVHDDETYTKLKKRLSMIWNNHNTIIYGDRKEVFRRSL